MNDCILEPRLFQVACSSDTPQFWHHAPINVMPAGGRQGMGWGFDFFKKNLQSNSLPTGKSLQSNATKFPHPQAAYCCQSQGGT